MSPLIVYSVCALLPVVFSADSEQIQKSMDEFEQKAADDKTAAAELRKRIDRLSEIYKSIITNLTLTKGNVSEENLEVLKQLTTAVHMLRALKTTEARERDEINLLQAFLNKVNLAQKWLTEDLGVLEKRKINGDEEKCQTIEAHHKAIITSRLLEEDDEKMILKAELKQANMAAFDAAQEKLLLEKKLEKLRAQWEIEVKSVYNLIDQNQNNLAELKSKLDEKNKDIQGLEKIVADLLRDKAELLVAIREAEIKFKKNVKVLKRFQPSAECYLAVRNSVAH